MALSNSDKREIEVMVRKEIKDFLNANTIKQFENKIVDTIKNEIKRGKIQGDINELVTKVMKEFYKIMWTRRSFWEPSLKNVK
jgi:anti-sigma28 factor (negative regulator of flagellin synthesis)